MFTKNVGSTDRVVRVVLGVIIFSLVFIGPQTAYGYLGLILIASAIISFCPIYSVFGFKSRPKE